MSRDFFFDAAGDRRMEKQNKEHWDALIARIDYAIKQGDGMRPQVDSLPKRRWDVLDVGCHSGKLLEAIQTRYGFPAVNLGGIEPLDAMRQVAKHKFPEGFFYRRIEDIKDQCVDLVVSHETLYLIEDLEGFVAQLKRVLRPDGGAFIALGSHAENSAWAERWRHRLAQPPYNHQTFVHKPIDILDVGERYGFDMEVGPLHPELPYVQRYSPPEDGWGEFESVKEMLEHRRQKLVFVFWPKR